MELRSVFLLVSVTVVTVHMTSPFVEANTEENVTSSSSDPPPPDSPVPYKTNLSDPLVVQAMVYINDFYKQHGDHRQRVGVKVINATMQTVEGAIYSFQIEVKYGGSHHADCDVIMLTQPWRNITSQLSAPQCNQTSDVILSSGQLQHPEPDTTSPSYAPPPPNTPIPYKTNLSDPYVVQAVVYINDFYKQQGDDRQRVAVKILNATVQVVSGFLYRFQIEVKYGRSRHEECEVTVLSKPWLNMTSQLSAPQCNETSDVISRRQLQHPENVTLFDPQVQKAYTLIEEKVNDDIRANITRLLRAGAVTQITRQKVNGAIFQFNDVKFWVTSCPKDVDLYSATCTYDVTSGPEVVCTGAVWWSPQQYPSYQLLGVECQ